MVRRSSFAIPFAVLALACGSADGDSDDPTMVADDPTTDSDPPDVPDMPDDPMLPPEPLESAFRDGVADPCATALDTGYLNDELCLEPPPAEMGFQLHFGPDDATDHDDPDAMAPFILEPGGEDTVCQYRRTPNEETRFVMEQHTRVRSGTHHLLIWGSPSAEADLAAPAEGSLVVAENCGAADGYQFQTGLQSALGPDGGSLDIPTPGVEVASEDRGLARLVRPGASVVLEMHYVNATDEPVLREAWANTIYTPPESVTAVVDPLMFLGGLAMQVPPHSTEVVGAGPCELPPGTDEVRLVGMNGHGHAHMDRLSAWIDRASGEREPIYESFDWSEPIVAQFSSARQNPAIGSGTFSDGAYSGVLTLGLGDRISWECEVTNDLDEPLPWANEAYTSEMCNIFGYYTVGSSSQSNGNWVCVTP